MVRLPCLPTSVTGAKHPVIGLPTRPCMPSVVAQRPHRRLGFTLLIGLFARLAERGITWVDLTLHIGVGTFRPIEAERLDDHVMHAELG